MLTVRIGCVLCILAALACPARAQESSLKDVNGDPLPPGAIARLGALRFRVGAPATAIRFLDGGKKLLVKANESNGNYSRNEIFQLFDAQTGQELSRFVASDYESEEHAKKVSQA